MGIEDYFVSDEFFNALGRIKNIIERNGPNDGVTFIEFVISCAIKYSILMSDGDKLSTEGLTEFVCKLCDKLNEKDRRERLSAFDLSVDEEIVSLYKDEIFKKFDIPKEMENDPNVIDKCVDYIYERLVIPDYIYHSFSSGSYDSILEHGLNPQYSNPYQKEIDEIDKIFEKHGISMIFGWQKLNCNGKVSYATTPSVCYYYGCGSPEWFSHFVGESMNFHPDFYAKAAFVINDHDAARDNIRRLMEEYDFSEEEKERVLTFFEDKWKVYAGKSPMLMIKKDTSDAERRRAYYASEEDSYFHTIQEHLSYALHSGYPDRNTDEIIPVDDAIFVKLPSYPLVRKKIMSSSIGDTSKTENMLYNGYSGISL